MKRAVLLFVAVLLAAPGGASAGVGDADRRVVVLGIDGLDPALLKQFMDEGIAPNFKRLAESGGFMPLGTTIPPQSPVAWSSFITGMDPGGHGIFDFIGLDRDTLIPYLSTARVEPPTREPLKLGKWRIPLGSGRTLQLRDGEAFFEVLERRGVPTTMFRVPANYPPIEAGGHSISGMGTPDMRGTSGTFTFFTDDPSVEAGKVSGGVIERVTLAQNRFEASIGGPPNPLLDKSPRATSSLTVHVDPEHPVAQIVTGSERVLLNEGEWSEWVSLDFELAPIPVLGHVGGMVRFYLQQANPHLRLYVSPVNIDPANAAQPIATPAEYGEQLAAQVGPFYTQEMPEDTKALSAGLLSPSEFLTQSGIVLEERRRLLRHELARFQNEQKRGLLFFYFSSIDQRGHMLWRQMDRKHPFHDPKAPSAVATAMRDSYVELDEIVGWTLDALEPTTTVMVMSDHGFSPFRRQANLNTWLEQNGYLKLRDPERRDSYEWLRGIDWSDTRAFAIGLNSLYLNVAGRERYGSIDPAERSALAREIADKLHDWVDPSTGAKVVTHAALREEIYHGPHVDEAPDLLVGYSAGYRASWGTTSGKIPAALIEDNDREWSGDHCMDARVVPGVLLSNRKLRATEADLRDLPVTILAEFGIEKPEQMQGEPVF